MSARNRERRKQNAEAESAREITWSDVDALAPTVVVTSQDRLGLFAGDGEEGFTAPESVRKDRDLLLAWCEKYEPQSILSDEAALVKAQNRCRDDLMAPLHAYDPKRRWTPADALGFLTKREDET